MGKPRKTNVKSLQQLLKERDDLLSAYPKLKPLQAEIDARLKEVGDDPVQRIQVIHNMLDDIVKNELEPSINELNETIGEYLNLHAAETARMLKKYKKVASG